MLPSINTVLCSGLAIIVMLALLFLFCIKNMSRRLQGTSFDHLCFILPCAWFTAYGMILRLLRNIDCPAEYVEELVVGFFIYGYTRGAADAKLGCETNIADYVRKHRSARPFLPMSTLLIEFAYKEGQNNVRQY